MIIQPGDLRAFEFFSMQALAKYKVFLIKKKVRKYLRVKLLPYTLPPNSEERFVQFLNNLVNDVKIINFLHGLFEFEEVFGLFHIA